MAQWAVNLLYAPRDVGSTPGSSLSVIYKGIFIYTYKCAYINL